MKVDRVTLRLPKISRKPVNKVERDSLIDLLKGYSPTVFYGGSYSGKKIFGCNIKIEGTKKSLWLEIYENGSGVFFIEEKGIRKEIEQFNTLKLRPEYVHRNPSSWVNADVGFDYIVNVLYFKEIMSRCGLEESLRDKYITLEQMKKIYYKSDGSKIYWDTLRKVEAYNLQTSLPTYSNYAINQAFVEELNECLQTYTINTYERICHFIAQCSVESECGYRLIERYGGSDPFTYFAHLDFNSDLGNNAKGDGAKYRGAGAIQLTGKDSYAKFSKNDAQVLTDGALYVGKKYFWAAAGYYWSVYKPSTANDDRFNLNKKCDENASVSIITGIVNGNSTDKLAQRQSAYNVCKEVLKNLK